jgi:hypoxanthine phosphoribosyltransferase
VPSETFNFSVVVVVDDFIATGNTIHSILKHFDEFTEKPHILAVSGTINVSYWDTKFQHIICERVQS